MSIKMKELMARTNTAKSTILYYVKEGLLPEPQKPKPNLHLYDEECIEIIKFIKYLQKNFSSSIAELKAIINDSNFDFDKGFETVMETLHVLMGSIHKSSHSVEYICDKYNITPQKLQNYVDDGLLFMREEIYTTKELEILEILLNLERMEMNPEVVKTYVNQARNLAKLEVEFTNEFLDAQSDKNSAVKALFDTTLILKPYLYNMHTLNAYQLQKENR